MPRFNPTPFSLLIHVAPDDIDEMGHVNNVVYVRWVQDVAAAHWDSVASAELKSRYSWVVLRHEIDYRNPAYAGELIEGTTWVGEYHGARFERFVLLTSKTSGKTLAEAKTMWCMLDAASGRPTRITPEVLEVL